jgi:hypothetical protein
VHIQSEADSDNGNCMMAMVMMVMMMVSVIVMIVPLARRQVDSVCQHACQTFHNLWDLHWTKASCGKPNSSQSTHLSAIALKLRSVMET